MERQKTQYVPPQIEVIQMENEGVIASSLGDSSSIPNVPMNLSNRNYGRGASSNDLEDMINDILTIGE